MTDLTTLAKALHRVYNDVEEAQAQRFYGEHARDEWENLAPSEVELWTVLAGHVVALRDAARAEQREAFVHQVHDGSRSECSFTYGGPNFRDEDAQNGLCTYTAHWKQCEHCKQRAAAIRAQGETR